MCGFTRNRVTVNSNNNMNPEKFVTANNLRKVAIVGGGTAGWITAAALAKTLENRGIEIVLVESADIGIIGVGEATIPPLMGFLRYLGIDEREFMAATQASYKLGIKFTDWHSPGTSYWHPFGSIGVNIDGQEFFPHWHKARASGENSMLWQYSPSAVMGESGRFYHPSAADKQSFLAGADYALHFDATLVAGYLRDYCLKRGVVRIEDTVETATLTSTGFIDELVLKNHPDLQADFFFDCSGMKGILIGEQLKVPYLDWSNYLLCNRAVALQTENYGNVPPFTHSVARDSGWTWHIPLQHRNGNGYVYSSAFCEPEEAERCLRESVEGKPLTDARHFSFTPGRREQLWYKNCLSLGFASGFLEPLESTAIHLTTKGVETFLSLLPNRDCHPALAQEFNRRFAMEYDSIRDFIVLHYCVTEREDTPFWRKCRELPLPPSLEEKIALYRAQGRIYRNTDDLFKPHSWHSVFDGMNVIPDQHNPMVDRTNAHEVQGIFTQVRELMQKMASGLPTHREFLERHCAAPKV